MRRLFLVLWVVLLAATRVSAIPACPDPVQVRQPDGSLVTIQLHGDEYLSYTTTADGYTVVQGPRGGYYYARLEGGVLCSTGLLAHDPSGRDAAELRATAALVPHQHPALTPAAATERQAEQQRRHEAAKARRAGRYDYTKFRGLVILVEYEDCAFSRPDYVDVISQMINERGYTGYMTNAMISQKIQCTGSVRDYFYDNSMGLFDPVFDIVGPVKIPYSQYDAHKTGGAMALTEAAVQAADSLVDFKDFDTDNNGTVDMVYFIFAGAGSNFSGNNQDLIWPHASQFLYTRLDNVTLGRYACSTELFGNPTRFLLDGIGTMCHEFGHVLGQVDEYDTDYDGSGGQSVHPGRWSVMASGSYNNESKTPTGYTALQRMIVGWAQPQLIDAAGDYALDPIHSSNTFYRLNSKTRDEYFVLENHQQVKWDAFLPGHGLMVYRIDSTDVSAWTNNRVNANPAHNFYQLLRARPQIAATGLATDYDGDPFPGSQGVTVIDNNSEPGLKSLSGMPSDLIVVGIGEDGDRARFHITEVENPFFVEDFEQMELNTADVASAEGAFASWKLTGVRIEEPDSAYCTSSLRAAAISRRGALQTTAPFEKKIQLLTVNVANPTSSSATFRIQYSTNGTTWQRAQGFTPDENGIVAAGEQRKLQFVINQENVYLQITEYTGNQQAPCYLDDVTLVCESEAMPDAVWQPLVPAATGRAYSLGGLPAGSRSRRPAVTIVDGRKVVR